MSICSYNWSDQLEKVSFEFAKSKAKHHVVSVRSIGYLFDFKHQRLLR